MLTSVSIRPMNSLVLISDLGRGKIPEWIRNKLILSTSSCIAVCCYPKQDGETEITLGDFHDVDPGFPPAFKGQLETPNRVVVIETVEREEILRSNVSDTRTDVRIWLSHSRWLDKVTIGLG